MSKGVIKSITLDKSVILKDETAVVTVDYTASGSGVFNLDDFLDPPSYLQTASSDEVHEIILAPPDNTISLKKLEIKTNNWTGVTESDYFLINTYSGQGSGIMNTLYNNTLNYTQVNYTRGYDDEYPVGSGVGYLTGYAAGSGDGYVAGSGAGYTKGFNDSYEAEDARLNTKNVIVHPGWNIFSPVKSGSMIDTDNVIIYDSLHMLNGTSYEKNNVMTGRDIEKGKGYIVKCEGSGSFTIDYS